MIRGINSIKLQWHLPSRIFQQIPQDCVWDFCIVVSHANIASPYLVLTKNILNSSKDASFTYYIKLQNKISFLNYISKLYISKLYMSFLINIASYCKHLPNQVVCSDEYFLEQLYWSIHPNSKVRKTTDGQYGQPDKYK